MMRRISAAAVLAVISSLACVLAIVMIVVMVGLLPPEDVVQLGQLAE